METLLPHPRHDNAKLQVVLVSRADESENSCRKEQRLWKRVLPETCNVTVTPPADNTTRVTE